MEKKQLGHPYITTFTAFMVGFWFAMWQDNAQAGVFMVILLTFVYRLAEDVVCLIKS